MTDPTPRPDLPTRAERQARNSALHATGTETGFWDDDGRPAPWPDDIEEWQPFGANPQRDTRDPTRRPGQ